MHIAQMLDTLYWGGAQKMQLFLVETLRPLGIDLTVISLHDTTDSPVATRLKAAGVRVVTFPFPRLFSPRSFLGLVNFLRAEKFDLLHAYLTYSNIIGPLAGKLSETPTIASLRSADFGGKSQTSGRKYLETISLRYLATRVMANGLAVEEFAQRRLNGTRAVDTIANAVDLVPPITQAERIEMRREISGDPERPLVLSVGRLTVAKGFHDLIEAFDIVRTRFPQAALVIAGGGSLLEEFTTHIRQLNLGQHVYLLGGRNDVPRLLACADVYVNSSHWEGTPVSVLEAMAAGLPVVATAVGESPYLLAEGTGLLVPPQQPQELADALISLLATPEKSRKMGSAARERIQKHYSREIWRRKLLDLYAQITPSAGPYLARVSNDTLSMSEA